MRPLVMGILNVTPDSFSDGGLYLRKEDAIRHAEQMVQDGVDIIDVGGESSRPGAKAISVDEELSRVIPIIQHLKQRFPVRLSIDTVKSEVARAAVDAGVTLINDISGGTDIRMAEIVKRPDVEIVLMHMRGTPVTMQIQPIYPRGVVEEVKEYLLSRVRAFGEAGVGKEKIWVDPGIGFGKTVNHNLDLLRRISEFQSVTDRVVVGTSQKSFLAHILGGPQVPYEERVSATIASNLWALNRGANVFRVHDVGDFKRALKVWEALSDASKS